MTGLPAFNASVICHSVSPCLATASGLTFTTAARWLPPNAGGLLAPGTLANCGRTRSVAMSWMSLMDLVSDEMTR